jgi:Ca2+-transporting ATPase
MGITGTDVAKEAADMVIADDSFSSIITGIREGRGLFQKIRSIIFFYIADESSSISTPPYHRGRFRSPFD